MLNKLVTNYSTPPYSVTKKKIIFAEIKNYLSNPSKKHALQLGIASGQETKMLAETFGRVDVIDGASKFIDDAILHNKFNNVKYIYSLFEEYISEVKYDYIFSTYVFEHVHSPQKILIKLKKHLSKNGLIFITVPNANAFSRRLALKLGIVNDLYALTENDLSVGHRRVYDSRSIRDDLIKTGFKIVKVNGIIFKILADFQLNQLMLENILTEEHIWSLQELGRKEVEYCDSILCVAKK